MKSALTNRCTFFSCHSKGTSNGKRKKLKLDNPNNSTQIIKYLRSQYYRLDNGIRMNYQNICAAAKVHILVVWSSSASVCCLKSSFFCWFMIVSMSMVKRCMWWCGVTYFMQMINKWALNCCLGDIPFVFVSKRLSSNTVGIFHGTN